MTPLLLQMEEQPVDVVAVHLDVWTSERIAFYKVGQAVDQGEGRAEFS